MLRLTTSLLIASFLLLGSGGLTYVHNLEHQHEDAHSGAPSDGERHHDESDCFLHAKLNSPIASGGWIPLLICLGVFVAFLTLLADQPYTRRHLLRLDCRGPPALLPVSA